MKRLEQWSLIHTGTPFSAPETVTTIATGDVYDDPRHEDGTHVHTSEVAEYFYPSRQIVTRSGSVYQLGEPDPKYLEAMRGQRVETDQLLGIAPQKPEAPHV